MITEPTFGLSRNERLHARKRIDALFAASNGGGYTYPFRYVLLEGDGVSVVEDVELEKAKGDAEQGVVAVLISVGKKYHKRAHVRNLLKRRIREAYRLNKQPLRSDCQQKGKVLSVALLYTSKEVVSYQTIEHAIQKIISSILVTA